MKNCILCLSYVCYTNYSVICFDIKALLYIFFIFKRVEDFYMTKKPEDQSLRTAILKHETLVKFFFFFFSFFSGSVYKSKAGRIIVFEKTVSFSKSY